MAIPSDTSPTAEQFIIKGYRAMSPSRKLERVVALNRALDDLAAARLRAQYGSAMTERELRLRLAALRLDADTMRTLFNWDPSTRGL
jgi:hypothetical protein